MHSNSALLFRKYALSHFRPGLHVLEIGPDTIPSTYQCLVADVMPCAPLVWDTLDLSRQKGLTYTATSAYTFPIPAEHYDLVLSGQVIEHVPRIWVWMKELARVCKSGGLVITLNPVSWPYHEAPVDCWRVYPEGMRALYQEASLEVIMSETASLESPHYRKRIPGRSLEWQSPKLRFAYRLLGTIGFPVECAFDTITIGKKSAAASPHASASAHSISLPL
jgi:SAM-dependent methyltransferase